MKGAVRLSVPGGALGPDGSHPGGSVHARRHLFRLSQLADGGLCEVGHVEDDDRVGGGSGVTSRRRPRRPHRAIITISPAVVLAIGSPSSPTEAGNRSQNWHTAKKV